MAIVVNGITCQEIVANLGEEFDLQSGSSIRKGFLCAWGSRFTVAQGLLGLNTSATVGGAVIFHTGAKYPDVNNAFVKNIQIEPVGTPSQGVNQVSYPSAIVWANYGPVPWFQNSQTQIDAGNPIYAEQEIDIGCEFISFPGQALVFSGGQAVNQDYSIRSPVVEMSCTFHSVPYIPVAAALQAGTINNATFFGCATGKLLFNGVRSRGVQQYDGTYAQNATYSFSYRPVARWDYGLNPSAGTWQLITTLSGGNTIISTSNFASLFPVYVPT